MRVLIDTNILVSAALSSGGIPYMAFQKAVTYPNFLSIALLAMEVVSTPTEEMAIKILNTLLIGDISMNLNRMHPCMMHIVQDAHGKIPLNMTNNYMFRTVL